MKKSFWSAALLFALALPACSKAEQKQTSVPVSTTIWEERVLGKADAPITILEYASLGCSHCAHFHAVTLPPLKKEYIDTGKAKLIFRDFPLEQMSLQAAQLARCLPANQYFGFTGLLFETQEKWLNAKGDITALKNFAAQTGMTAAEADACLANKALTDTLLQKRMEGEQVLKVEATPTIFINNEKIKGDTSFEALKKKLDVLNK